MLDIPGSGGCSPTNPVLEALLGRDLYADLTNHGFSLFKCIVVDGDVVVDDLSAFLDTIHRGLGAPEHVTAWVLTGNLTCEGRLDVDHRLVVLGTVTCSAFVDHSDADFYAGRLLATRFASSACSGCDRIGRIDTPYFFEWDYPQVVEYGPKMVIFELSADDLERGNKRSRLIWRNDFAPALHSSLTDEFANSNDYPEPDEQFWAIRNDLDAFIDAVDERLSKSLPILR